MKDISSPKSEKSSSSTLYEAAVKGSELLDEKTIDFFKEQFNNKAKFKNQPTENLQ